MREWISVENTPPPNDEFVIGTDGYKVYLWKSTTSQEILEILSQISNCSKETTPTTLWMPLPEPPRKNDE